MLSYRAESLFKTKSITFSIRTQFDNLLLKTNQSKRLSYTILPIENAKSKGYYTNKPNKLNETTKNINENEECNTTIVEDLLEREGKKIIANLSDIIKEISSKEYFINSKKLLHKDDLNTHKQFRSSLDLIHALLYHNSLKPIRENEPHLKSYRNTNLIQNLTNKINQKRLNKTNKYSKTNWYLYKNFKLNSKHDLKPKYNSTLISPYTLNTVLNQTLKNIQSRNYTLYNFNHNKTIENNNKLKEKNKNR